MTRSRLALVAALSVIAFAAQADDADPAGQFAHDAQISSISRTAVQANLAAYRQGHVNPWAMSYNPLKSFTSTATRSEVRADFLASRDAVSAMTGEDSGSVWLETHAPAAVNQLADSAARLR